MVSIDGSWLFIDDRWKLPRPIPPRVAYFFIVYFLLSNFTGEQWFLLLFTFFWWEISHFGPFSLHSRVLVFVSLLSRVCVCVLGGDPSSLVNNTWRQLCIDGDHSPSPHNCNGIKFHHTKFGVTSNIYPNIFNNSDIIKTSEY